MANSLILPQSAADLVETAGISGRNPGLQLDKLSPPGDQRSQRSAIDIVCRAAGDEGLLQDLFARRATMMTELAAHRFQATTTGPLTLHLARAAGLENAGIYLHPIYGFACLPGSGLKGMTRAYAETIWLADQDDQAAAWLSIQEVFGTAVGTGRKAWQPAGAQAVDGSAAGFIVFHDAWPTTWPKLEADITNSHHTNYYQDKDDPGDWESLTLVSFIAVGEGQTFDFGISARDPGRPELTQLAATWQQAALVHVGAGAKTNAGYGRFALDDLPEPPAPVAGRRIARHNLTLATPAFLAGARQDVSDCDLRPATLRGQLRWWWRTMHAGHLGRDALRRLETAIWGDAQNGAALALALRPINRPEVRLFDYKDGNRPAPTREFRRDHDLERPQQGTKTTQGLFYASYGMDGMRDGQKSQRWYAEPGAEWLVTFSARSGMLPGADIRLSAEDVLRQAEAALWLLARYGGVGSKARKGFGAFSDLSIAGVQSGDDCKAMAADLRSLAKLPPGRVDGSSLDEMMTFEADTPWSDPWFAMDQVGFVYQETVKSFREDEQRAALGLPRSVGPRPGRALQIGRIDRHASPLHWSLSPGDGGALRIRLTAFPAARLPDLQTSSSVLEAALTRARQNLEERIGRHSDLGARRERVPRGGRDARRNQSGDTSRAALPPKPLHPAGLPPNGEEVQVVLLEEKTKKGAWRARHVGGNIIGTIENSSVIPGDAEAGQTVTLLVVNRVNFLWPDEAARARFAKRKTPPSGGRPQRGKR